VSESWRDLVQPFGDVRPSTDLLPGILEREAALLAGARRALRVPRAARWVLAAAGCALVVGALALAAHSRGNAPTPAHRSSGKDTVVLTAQRGSLATGHVTDWVTSRRVTVTCPARGVGGSTVAGTQSADLCPALAYYARHSNESRCSYLSIHGFVVPRRVLIEGSINGRAVRLNMGMVCNPPARLAEATGVIYQAAFSTKPALSSATIQKLTAIAKNQAQSLGDPSVHRAEAVLTTRGRMNTALGFGHQPEQDQHAKVYVIQLLGAFTCDGCSHPSGASAPTGTAAQVVLSYDSLSTTDFGLTLHPVSMERMGTIVSLSWK
jgi:hypothetical protein